MGTLHLKTHGPFCKYLIAFQSLGVSVISLENKTMRPAFDDRESISYGSKTGEIIYQHINEIYKEYDLTLTLDSLSELLACMLINICYETVRQYNDRSPEFEFFRHIRNAASHNNIFSFKPNEPRRIATWRGIDLQHMQKGTTNPYFGKKCIGETIGSADILHLLSEIECKIPKEYYKCECCANSFSHSTL